VKRPGSRSVPQEQVEVERIERTSRFGDGNGDRGECTPATPDCAGTGETQPDTPDNVAGSTSDSPSEIVETRAPGELRRCVQGPGGLRQTEDPQSPPCKREIFTGDNGGATWTGITATDIRVAWPTGLDENGNPTGHDRALEDAMVAHVNQHYELYGRRFVPVPIDSTNLDGSAASARAFARDVAATEVFASLGVGSGAPTFHRELASRGIVSVVYPSQPSAPVGLFEGLHPHVWSTTPAIEEALDATAALVCDELRDARARHAGADLSGAIRRFGVVVETRGGDRVDPQRLLTGLEACDEDVQKLARNQRSHTFGLTADFRALSSPSGTSSSSRRFEEQYWHHAMKDGDPQATTTSNLRPFYQQLLMLAAGIQWAGPELTPAAFGEALSTMRFANPWVGQPRWFQPSVTLGPGDHGWNSDFAMIWWDMSAEEEERVSPAMKGRACYVGNGIRVTATTIPADADATFFDPEAGCR